MVCFAGTQVGDENLSELANSETQVAPDDDPPEEERCQSGSPVYAKLREHALKAARDAMAARRRVRQAAESLQHSIAGNLSNGLPVVENPTSDANSEETIVRGYDGDEEDCEQVHAAHTGNACPTICSCLQMLITIVHVNDCVFGRLSCLRQSIISRNPSRRRPLESRQIRC